MDNMGGRYRHRMWSICKGRRWVSARIDDRLAIVCERDYSTDEWMLDTISEIYLDLNDIPDVDCDVGVMVYIVMALVFMIIDREHIQL